MIFRRARPDAAESDDGEMRTVPRTVPFVS